MKDPKHVLVESIRPRASRNCGSAGKIRTVPGQKLCFVDDVVSTGGTVDAAMTMAKEIRFEISVIACVLTEGGRTHYRRIP